MPKRQTSISNNLGAARRSAGMTQKQVSDLTGTPLSTLRRWEQGQNDPDMGAVTMLADLYGVTTDTLLGSRFGVDIPDAKRARRSSRIARAVRAAPRQIPIVGRMGAGDAIEAIEQSGRSYPVADGMYDGIDLVWVEVSGNSMNRLFPDGSLAMVDRGAEVRNGDVAAVFVNGDDVTVKRVYFEQGAMRLHPESYDPEYRDRVIRDGDPGAPDVHMFGKVIGFSSRPGWRA